MSDKSCILTLILTRQQKPISFFSPKEVDSLFKRTTKLSKASFTTEMTSAPLCVCYHYFAVGGRFILLVIGVEEAFMKERYSSEKELPATPLLCFSVDFFFRNPLSCFLVHYRQILLRQPLFFFLSLIKKKNESEPYA